MMFLPRPKLMDGDSLSDEHYEKIKKIEDMLLNCYNPQSDFGFRDRELHSHDLLTNPHCSEHSKIMIESENIGLLSGISGILLSLISQYTDKHLWAIPFAIEES